MGPLSMVRLFALCGLLMAITSLAQPVTSVTADGCE